MLISGIETRTIDNRDIKRPIYDRLLEDDVIKDEKRQVSLSLECNVVPALEVFAYGSTSVSANIVLLTTYGLETGYIVPVAITIKSC